MKEQASKGYMVYFDFTTVHRGSRFIGRSGELYVTTEYSPDEIIKSQELSNLIASVIYSKNPKWNILLMNITQIIPQ